MSFRFNKRDGLAPIDRRLKLRELGAAYSMARRAWVQHGSLLADMTAEQQREALRSVSSDSSIDMATLLLILKIAIQLWQWWSSQNVSNPPERAGKHESNILATGGQDDE